MFPAQKFIPPPEYLHFTVLYARTEYQPKLPEKILQIPPPLLAFDWSNINLSQLKIVGFCKTSSRSFGSYWEVLISPISFTMLFRIL